MSKVECGIESEVAELYPTLCKPVDCSPPGSSVHGILQARILQWVAILFSRRSSRPRDWTRVSRIVGRRFTVWVTREVLSVLQLNIKWPHLFSCLVILLAVSSKLSYYSGPVVKGLIVTWFYFLLLRISFVFGSQLFITKLWVSPPESWCLFLNQILCLKIGLHRYFAKLKSERFLLQFIHFCFYIFLMYLTRVILWEYTPYLSPQSSGISHLQTSTNVLGIFPGQGEIWICILKTS